MITERGDEGNEGMHPPPTGGRSKRWAKLLACWSLSFVAYEENAICCSSNRVTQLSVCHGWWNLCLYEALHRRGIMEWSAAKAPPLVTVMQHDACMCMHFLVGGGMWRAGVINLAVLTRVLRPTTKNVIIVHCWAYKPVSLFNKHRVGKFCDGDWLPPIKPQRNRSSPKDHGKPCKSLLWFAARTLQWHCSCIIIFVSNRRSLPAYRYKDFICTLLQAIYLSLFGWRHHCVSTSSCCCMFPVHLQFYFGCALLLRIGGTPPTYAEKIHILVPCSLLTNGVFSLCVRRWRTMSYCSLLYTTTHTSGVRRQAWGNSWHAFDHLEAMPHIHTVALYTYKP